MMGGGAFFGGGILWLLIIGAIVVIAVLLVRDRGLGGGSATGPSTRRDQDKTPLEILEIRYAKGEIDEEEYEKKRRDLGKTSR